MDEAISCSNDLVESSFVVYMVVSISNLYSFEVCIIYNLLWHGSVLHGYFKNHLSIENVSLISLEDTEKKGCTKNLTLAQPFLVVS